MVRIIPADVNSFAQYHYNSFLLSISSFFVDYFLKPFPIQDYSTGRVIRRFHLGVRHAADTLGRPAIRIVHQLKTTSVKFRVVRPLVKGLEVKTPYGLGTIVKLKGVEGVAGFSLVVQLDSWILAGGQKPMLYCEADEVVAVTESYGTLLSNGSRAMYKSAPPGPQFSRCSCIALHKPSYSSVHELCLSADPSSQKRVAAPVVL